MPIRRTLADLRNEVAGNAKLAASRDRIAAFEKTLAERLAKYGSIGITPWAELAADTKGLVLAQLAVDHRLSAEDFRSVAAGKLDKEGADLAEAHFMRLHAKEYGKVKDRDMGREM